MPSGLNEALALTGMMGAGKTTVAAILGRLLRRPVISTDARAVAIAGKPIDRIFAEDGEPAFRALERAAVRQLRGPVVIDLGGGAFCDPDSASHLLRVGRVVHLDVSEAEAARRMAGGAGRPLAARWAALEAERLPFYRRAHSTVGVDGLTPEAVAHRILGMLGWR